MPKLLLILFLATLKPLPQEPQILVWELLGLTTYKNDFSLDGELSYKPQFPGVLEKLEGQEVMISGYMVPMDVTAKQYALSKNSFKSCFFCGNAGPETVMELQFKEAPGRFATDEYVTVTGILKLNRNGQDLFFTLTKAEIE